jgi:hypothetical protein
VRTLAVRPRHFGNLRARLEEKNPRHNMHRFRCKPKVAKDLREMKPGAIWLI